MTEEHFIEVKKTARYYTLGTLSDKTTEVWFVLHGYAQLAKEFIQEFDVLKNENRVIIAPEGLNRFYAKGFGGKPAATWMTSEDRTHEISDYINYLNLLYRELHLSSFTGKIILLGFSQGVATASRWMADELARFHHFVICSGDIAHELQQPLHPVLTTLPVTYITGKKDPFIVPEKHEAYYHLMSTLNARIIEFNEGHVIDADSLITAANNLFAQ